MLRVRFVSEPILSDGDLSVEHSHVLLVFWTCAEATFQFHIEGLFHSSFPFVQRRRRAKAREVVAVDNTLEVPSGMVKTAGRRFALLKTHGNER